MAGPWRIEHLLGRGGMGTGYAVVHAKIGKLAALKVLHRSLLRQGFNAERMLLEARVVNEVRHPGIVDIFDTGSLPDGTPYIVMERLHGESLGARAERSIAPREAIDLLIEICDALSAAHAAGVVHRDLKFDNIYLVESQDPRSPRVKILDWGIARVLQQGAHHTAEGQVVGTPAYLAPEQARGAPVTPKTDVYSLGVGAYRLLLGQMPFDADAANEIVAMHLLMPPPPPRSVWPQIPR